MKKLVVFIIVIAGFHLVAYFAVIYYDNNFKYGRMRETPGVRPHEEPLPLMEAGIVPVFGGDAVYQATPADLLVPPAALAGAEAGARGKAVYFTFCAQCHGPQMDGNGTVGQSFQPLPTDLRSPAVQAKPTGALFRSISYGTPDGRQPPLDTTITVNDRWCVIAFVKSLGLRQ
jgi:mono/diheme cytochrome c family protein